MVEDARVFQRHCREQRVVLIPSGLSAEQRAAFVSRVTAAVRRQAALAERCPAVLSIEPEVSEQHDRLVVLHEPAAPLAWPLPPPPPDIQTLWWLTIEALLALKAGTEDLSPHGGIQPAALLQDPMGRVKLTDFGIAPAYEAVCGVDQRRGLHCTTPEQTADSGVWSLLTENEYRSDGWIASYFGHELLEDRLPLNARSDQFALGMLLFAAATARHPYGAAFDDPALRFYFQVEPARLDEERGEWAPAFERQAKLLAQPADRPILEWAGLLERLLARDATARFANLAEAVELARRHTRPAWEAAALAVEQARRALHDGQSDAALASLQQAPLDELPPAWRARLDALRDAARRGDLSTNAPRLRRTAPPPHAPGADDAERQQREATCRSELAAARQELAGGAFDAARLRLMALLALPDLPAELRQPTMTALTEVQEARGRRAEQAEALEQARTAWERGDAVEMQRALARAAGEGADREIAAARAGLEKRLACLTAARAQWEAAQRACEAGAPGSVLAPLSALVASEELPRAYRDELAEWLAQQTGRSTAPPAPERLEAVVRMHDVLDEAEAAVDRGDSAQARRLLATLDPSAETDAEVRDRRDLLAGRAQRAEELQSELEEYRRLLERQDYAVVVRETARRLGEWAPGGARRELAALQATANLRLTDHRRAVDETLDGVELEIARRGRRAKQIEARLGAVRDDGLAAPPQQARAVELLERFAGLPPPPPPWRKPALLAGAAALMCAIAVWGYVALRPGPAPDPNRVDPNRAGPNHADPNRFDPNRADPNKPTLDPVETLARLRAAVQAELAAVLSDLSGLEVVHEEGQTRCTLTVEGGRRPLVESVPLALPQAGTALESAVQAARAAARQAAGRLVLRRDALAALTRGPLPGSLLEAYDGRVELAPPPPGGDSDDLALGPADLSDNSVGVLARARLRDDPRPSATFRLSGTWRSTGPAAAPGAGRDGRLEIDQATRAAFAEYLGSLQVDQAARVEAVLRETLALPGDFPIRLPPAFRGGPRLLVQLGPENGELAAEALTWDAARLVYAVDADALRLALLGALRRQAADAETARRLTEDWPAQRSALAPAQGAAGSAWWASCLPLEIAARDAAPSGLLRVPVTIIAGPPDAPPAERVSFEAELRYEQGRLAWDTGAGATARDQIARRLAELSADANLRARRAQRLTDALRQKDRGVRYEVSVSDALEVVAERECRRVRSEVAWDAAALDWTPTAVTTPPELAGLEAKLASAAQLRPMCAQVLAYLAAMAATEKAALNNILNYELPETEQDEAAARSQLVELSRALQRHVARDPRQDAYPTVFIEFLATPKAVYGLSWRAVVDDSDSITDVADFAVWEVMSRADLDALEPERFRGEYARADGRWTGRLLDPALPETVAGDTFGVLIAPDGPLWLTRWEQVRFRPRRVAGLGGDDPPPAQIDRLRDLIAPGRDGRYRRAGLWCMPLLAATWKGDPQDLYKVGVLTPGGVERSVRFRSIGRDGQLTAAILEYTGAGPAWGTFARTLEAREAGAAFWNFGWKDASYQPQSARVLVLPPQRPTP